MSDDGPWLTVADISRRLGRPYNSVRNWRNAYRDLLPVQTDQDGLAVYPLALFREIARMRAEGHSPRDIRDRLSGAPEQQIPPADPLERLVSIMTDVLAELREIKGLLKPPDQGSP